jgi:ACR3 family arsenite transporter
MNQFEYAKLSIPDGSFNLADDLPYDNESRFSKYYKCWQKSKRVFVSWITNWFIKPFTMYAIASLFIFVILKAFISPDLATEYLAGAVLLGTAPCTAMVFVWSSLTKDRCPTSFL